MTKTLEEVAEEYAYENYRKNSKAYAIAKEGFVAGYKEGFSAATEVSGIVHHGLLRELDRLIVDSLDKDAK